MESKTGYKFDALVDMNQRGAFSLYCDDVRPESSGKTTIVGTYGSAMLLPNLPAILPTFFIITTVWTSRSRPFSKLIFRVLLDQDVLSEDVMDVQEAQARFYALSGEELNGNGPNSRQLIQRVARFSPFVVEKECALRVRIETEDGELRTSGLSIRKGVKPVEAEHDASAPKSTPSE